MQENCRICNEDSTQVFTKKQLGKYLVRYFQCSCCGSLQTESPYWIGEAYHNLSFAKDTGMVSRTQFCARLSLELALHQNFDRDDLLLDYGGGTGLLTRMLRDCGLNAFWNDKYAKNIFAIGFEKELAEVKHPKLITAFEVFEHLANPAEEISSLLKLEPEFLLFSTKLYQGQGELWWYLLEDGQHLQFYSKNGLEKLSKNFNYHFSTEGSTYHLFSRKDVSIKKICQKVRGSKVEKKALKKWPSRTEDDFKLI